MLHNLSQTHDVSPWFDEEDLENLLGQTDIKEYEGATEHSEEDFDNFQHTCPRCGFEFDGKN